VSHPSLQTDRLLLRPWRPAADLDALVRLNADPEVMRWVTPHRPLTADESAEMLDRLVRHWDDHGFGLWALIPREPGAGVVGFAGLAVPSFLPEVLPTVEVGWRLAPAWWGRGLATEAARASIDHGFERLGLRSVVSIIDERNARSLRLARRLGMFPGKDRLHPITRRRLRVMELRAPVECLRKPPGTRREP
jgi:RimJ/RimL family protein N-acetyltransferase